jgi:hypothetical protein
MMFFFFCFFFKYIFSDVIFNSFRLSMIPKHDEHKSRFDGINDWRVTLFDKYSCKKKKTNNFLPDWVELLHCVR